MYRSAFPDVKLAIDEQIAGGGKVVTRWSATRTHRGELFGTAPTGKQVADRVRGTSLYCDQIGASWRKRKSDPSRLRINYGRSVIQLFQCSASAPLRNACLP
jgi:hypothetical protein